MKTSIKFEHKTIGQKMAQCRKAVNLTQWKLSELSGIDVFLISQFERDLLSPANRFKEFNLIVNVLKEKHKEIDNFLEEVTEQI